MEIKPFFEIQEILELLLAISLRPTKYKVWFWSDAINTRWAFNPLSGKRFLNCFILFYNISESCGLMSQLNYQ